MSRHIIFIKRVIISLSLLFLLGALGVFLGVEYLFWTYGRHLPNHEILRRYEPAAVTRVHAGDGRLIAEYAAQNRTFISIEGVPDILIKAYLSAEDQNFYSHYGVDFVALVRAIGQNVYRYFDGRRLIGASTITQQVAKNFLIGNEASFLRKIREAILAFRIEQSLSKNEILELYVNDIYLGYGSYGIASASLNYFNKSLQDLDLWEVAYLAALPKGPGNYHPVLRRDAALWRRNWVLDRMYADGYIGLEERDDAQSRALGVTPRDSQDFVSASYFLEEVRKEAAKAFGTNLVNQGGLSVRTTLDSVAQNILVESLRGGLLAYDRRHGFRGALASLAASDLEDESWQKSLRTLIDSHSGFVAGNPHGWDLGVVLSFSGVRADIGVLGFNDGIASRGILRLSELEWARRALAGGKRGSKITSADQVLSVGDVIFVSPLLAGAGEYALHQVPELEGAGVILDPHSGRILALTGGWDFARSEFNRATQAFRQPGSAFKPFVYLAGLESGLTPISKLLDAPYVEIQSNGRKWRPANFSRKFYGVSPMYLGIEKSRNLMTVRLANILGTSKISDVASRFGIQKNMPHHLSMALGAGETSLLRLTAAYAMLVNGGKKIVPTLIDQIQNRHGRTIFKHDKRACLDCTWDDSKVDQQASARNDFGVELEQNIKVPRLQDVRPAVTTPQAAYQVVTMLERVIQHGTGKRIRDLNLPLAGKTGTTNDSYDAWFIGFSPDLAVGIFTGFDTPRTLGYQPNTAQETGSSVAAPIFKDIMRQMFKTRKPVPFRTPNGIDYVWIDTQTYQPATEHSKDKVAIAFTSEYVARNYRNLTSSQTSRPTYTQGLY